MARSALPMLIDRAQILALADRADCEEWTKGDGPLVASALRDYILVTDLLRERNASIRRLKRLVFGASSERRASGDGEATSDAASKQSSGEEKQHSGTSGDDKPKAPGHGRIAA